MPCLSARQIRKKSANGDIQEYVNTFEIIYEVHTDNTVKKNIKHITLWNNFTSLKVNQSVFLSYSIHLKLTVSLSLYIPSLQFEWSWTQIRQGLARIVEWKAEWATNLQTTGDTMKTILLVKCLTPKQAHLQKFLVKEIIKPKSSWESLSSF